MPTRKNAYIKVCIYTACKHVCMDWMRVSLSDKSSGIVSHLRRVLTCRNTAASLNVSADESIEIRLRYLHWKGLQDNLRLLLYQLTGYLNGSLSRSYTYNVNAHVQTLKNTRIYIHTNIYTYTYKHACILRSTCVHNTYMYAYYHFAKSYVKLTESSATYSCVCGRGKSASGVSDRNRMRPGTRRHRAIKALRLWRCGGGGGGGGQIPLRPFQE